MITRVAITVFILSILPTTCRAKIPQIGVISRVISKSYPLLGMYSHNAPISHGPGKIFHVLRSHKGRRTAKRLNPGRSAKWLIPGFLEKKEPHLPNSYQDRDYVDVSFFQLYFS